MSKRAFCYFDNNATTQVAPEVVEAMLPYLTELWGNPSSAYRFGKEVARHLDGARVRMAEFIRSGAAGDRVHELRDGEQQCGDPERVSHASGATPCGDDVRWNIRRRSNAVGSLSSGGTK
jgi:hypothetical protein